MASDNLNRVFIKAYGKGKPTSYDKSNIAATVDQHDAWIVRFDTATLQSVVVPQMHKPKPPRTETALAQPSHSPTLKHSQQKRSLAEAAPSELENNSKSTGQSLDSPILTTEPQPSNGILPAGTDLSEFLGGTTMVVPQANISPKAKDSPKIDPVELERQIAAKNKSGEIFRLDRPSYAGSQHPQDVFADEHASSPSEASGLSAGSLLNAINESRDTPQTATLKGPNHLRGERMTSANPQYPELTEKVKAQERDLRSARVRVFNPLWEVDRLEWPRICLELLQAIDAKSPGIADNLLNACQDGLQVLAVTSPQSGAGTSTVACCLAMIAGRHGLKIALVDGNMENPSLCYQTNLELEVDWHEAVARKLPLEEIAVHSVDDQVTLVPLLARLSAPQLNEQNIAKMLSELSQSFDLVLVDVGHMGSSRNMVTALGDLGAINAVVAVVDRRNSSAERIESCLRQIRQTGISSIGLIENFAA